MSSPNDAVTTYLQTLASEQRRDFSAKLVPTVPAGRFMGVKVGDLRALAKAMRAAADADPRTQAPRTRAPHTVGAEPAPGQTLRTPAEVPRTPAEAPRAMGAHGGVDAADNPAHTSAADFLAAAPHPFIEHDILHVLLLNEETDFAVWQAQLTEFLPHIDNWMVADAINPRVLRTHPEQALTQARAWLADQAPYAQRVGLVILIAATRARITGAEMLEAAKRVDSDHYYVNMAAGWFVATVFEFHPEETKPYLEDQVLAPEVRRLAVRKIIESRKTSPADREWARQLRAGIKNSGTAGGAEQAAQQ